MYFGFVLIEMNWIVLFLFLELKIKEIYYEDGEFCIWFSRGDNFIVVVRLGGYRYLEVLIYL